MAEWAPEARDHLEYYLQGLESQAEPGARQRIIFAAETAAAEGTVTLEHLLQVIAQAQSTPAAPAPASPPPLEVRTPVPPPLPHGQVRVLSHQRVSGSGGLSQGCIIAIIVGGVCFAGLVFVGLVAAMLIPAMSAGHEAARRASCANNLRQLGLVYKMYASEHEYYPTMEPERGTLVPARHQIYPEYLSEPVIFNCPSLSDEVGDALEDKINDDSYVYFSHALPDEASGIAWTNAYSTATFDELEKDIRIEGQPPLLRLRELTPRMLEELGLLASEESLPVMVEWTWNHSPSGNNALFLDGHVEYLEDDVERFPNTTSFIEALWALEEHEEVE